MGYCLSPPSLLQYWSHGKVKPTVASRKFKTLFLVTNCRVFFKLFCYSFSFLISICMYLLNIELCTQQFKVKMTEELSKHVLKNRNSCRFC